ncbi:MAG TPA: hypothetical protein VHS29_08360, partial [Candidatus Acidoferrales bacterium]|nr:hypothetical protein [Candidatus Acidoferrales bacterium]
MAARKPNTHFEHVPLEIAIMKRQPNGKAYWVEAAKDVKSATKRVHALAKQFPGEYVIVNKKTREE